MIQQERLKEISIFRELPDTYVERLAGIITEGSFKAGEIIFREGTPGTALYIVASGCVEIQKKTDTAHDSFKTLAIFEKGDIFGEMSLLDDKTRSASACAKDAAVLFILNRNDFLSLMQSSPDTAVDQLLGLLRILSDRLRHTSVELTTLFELGQALTSQNDVTAVCGIVLEKLSTALERKTNVWMAVWNRFNEEYDVRGHESDNVWDRNHPLITLMNNLPDGWISNDAGKAMRLAVVSKEPNRFAKIIGVPVKKSSQEVMGYIYASRDKDAEDFRQADRILMSAVASFTASALINISFVQEELQRVRLQQGKATW